MIGGVPAAESAGGADEPDPLGTLTRGALALVVDDDPTMRLMLQSTLARAGMRTAAFGDARSALAGFELLAPDLALLDIGLPDIDGCTLCSKLRALPHGQSMPVLMLTGHDDASSVERAYLAGATDFIAKPINWEILVHRVRYILRSARAFADVASNRAQLADAQRVAGLGSWQWRPARDELQCSDEARRLLGLPADMPLATLERFLSPIDAGGREQIRRKLLEVGRTGVPARFEQAFQRRDGEQRLLQVFGEVRRDGDGGGAPLIHGTVQDVTERRQAEQRMQHLAYHDALTGLPNRAWLNEELERALARAERQGSVFALMFLDIDQFKRINDTLGHAVGDQLLCAVAERLKLRLRRGDALARLGGDEFCIVLNDLDQPETAARAASRVLESFAEPFRLLDREAAASTSIGIAVYPHDATDTESLVKAADTAMYHTKKQGRNSHSFYSPSMNARALERMTIESALRRAIERDQLVLHYQPVVALDTGAIVGLEALVRWQHPELGLLMPGRFIEVAEESGLIVPLGQWVLHTACAQSSGWQAEGLPALTMAVNVSGEQFRRTGLVQTVQRALDENRLDPATLKLEITESSLMRDLEVTLPNLTRVSEMGVRLSIDDFGTGYSSLAYLERFPVHELKLDRSFVGNIVGGERNAAIATAVIRMAGDLSLALVAEGVEEASQRELLRRLRCPQAQGYYFCRPQPAHTISALLRGGLVLPLRPVAEPGSIAHG